MAEKQKEPRETLKVKSLEFLFSTGIFKGQPVTCLHRARAHGGHPPPARRARAHGGHRLSAYSEVTISPWFPLSAGTSKQQRDAALDVTTKPPPPGAG